VPAAVSIDPHYSDQLWIKDSRFENITGAAVLIGNDGSRMTEINFEDILCRHVPVFAKLRESGREFKQVADTYKVSVFSHGLGMAYPGAVAAFETRYEASALAALPPPAAAAITPLPAASTWVNVSSLGAPYLTALFAGRCGKLADLARSPLQGRIEFQRALATFPHLARSREIWGTQVGRIRRSSCGFIPAPEPLRQPLRDDRACG
jgi:hypothetical protein